MLLPDTLLLPSRTLCGDGALFQLAEAAAVFGASGVIVHGRAFSGPLRDETLARFPPSARVSTYHYTGDEPTLEAVEALRAALRERSPDWVAAIGGGSVLDAAKAAAGLLHAPAPVHDYHRGAAIPPATTPLIAVPTTAGTGSEATIVAVLTDAAATLKQSIRQAGFMPRTVILDPRLLLSCPRATLAAAGMDAVTQAYESWVSRHATPFTRDLSARALRALVRALPAMAGGDTAAARDLLEGSYLAGLALSHARLGIVHGLAHPLGVRTRAPHGVVCACCLPLAIRFNAPVTAGHLADIEAAIGTPLAEWVDRTLAALDVRSPFAGHALRDRAAVIEETLRSGSTRANPREVTASDVDRLLDTLYAP
jgi:alcohol dehydrogenase class IV